MGANHSNTPPCSGGPTSRPGVQPASSHHRRSKAKPGPPSRPMVTHVTSSTARITWLPPRLHGTDVIAYTVEMCGGAGGFASWRQLSSACQAPRFEARYLDADASYVFRVRAQNIYGVGKPSAASLAVTTCMFQTEADPPTPAPSPQRLSISSLKDYHRANSIPKTDITPTVGAMDPTTTAETTTQTTANPVTSGLKRRHSFNVQIDGSLPTKVLSHSSVRLDHADRVAPARLTRTSSCVSRTPSLRASIRRSSTTPIVLPGAANDDLNRLRESRNSIRSSSSEHAALASLRRTEASRVHARDSRSSTGSSLCDYHANPVVAGDDPSRRGQGHHRGSKISLRSSISDLTVSHSRDGNSSVTDAMSSGHNHSSDSNSRSGSLWDCTTLSDQQDVKRLSASDSSETDKSSLDEQTDHFMNKFNDLNNILSHFGESIFSENSLDLNNDSDFKPDVDNIDEITLFKEGLRKLDNSEGPCKMDDLRDRLQGSLDLDDGDRESAKGFYSSMEHSWEKIPAAPAMCPQNILSAPVTDDYKLSLYDRNLNDVISLDRLTSPPSPPWMTSQEPPAAEDFRALRAVLQGKTVLVRAARRDPDPSNPDTRPLTPDLRPLTRGSTLTTIVDADEEDEVRVTTL